jgi:transposase
MKSDLLEHKVIHADETVVQVLNEPGKKAKTESRMWVYCAGEIGCKDNILFEYQPTRNGDHAKKFLEGFTGHLVTDGYSGYGKLTDVTRCGCWAHLRRKFIEALPDDKEAAKTSNAATAIEYIDKLFELERDCKTDEDRQKQRQKSEKTLIDEFYTWLETLNPAGLGLSKAVGYALSQKKYLKAYLDNPSVPLSNNRAENAIRPFCIGRKNWLFSNSVKGAEASALFYSIASTAKANGLNIEQYFTELFKTIPNTKFSTNELLHLLPYKD